MEARNRTSAKPGIVILGAGFAGLEAAFLLRMRLKDRVDLTVVADRGDFVFRPNTIYVPFGVEPEALLVGLDKPMGRRDISFVEGDVTGVDPDRGHVALADGSRLGYDKLVIATGADTAAAEIPGLARHAATIWTAGEMLEVRAAFQRVLQAARAQSDRRVLFLVPPNNKCAGPLYEVILMFETWLRREGGRDRVSIALSTYEDTYIQAFGPRLHEVVGAEFVERGIEGRTGEVVREVSEGEVRMEDGTSRPFDELIAFPPYVAGVRYESLPGDDRGFIATEQATRQVSGHPEIYAPGDAGDFPVKQAFLAFLQADAVAEHISAEVAGHEFETPFDPVSMCVMEMFDKATFAQVPLELTGDPAHPVAVRAGAGDDYKVGTGKLWRLGKKVLGFSVPMRFGAGEPFHAGAGWQMMDAGLKGMSAMMAD